jgi:hypothetical protein
MLRPLLAMLTLVGLVVILSNNPLLAADKGNKAGKKGAQTQ